MSRRSRSESMAAAAAEVANKMAEQNAPGWEPAPAESVATVSVGESARKDDVPPPREFKVGNETRDNLMKEILDSRAKAIQEEVKQAPFEPAPQPAKAVEPVASVSEEKPAKAVEPAQAVEPAPAAVEPELVTLKIDGEEIRVPKAEVEADGGVAAAQIKRAMEKRLRAANDTLAQTRQALEIVNRLTQGQQPAQPQAAQPQSIDDIIRNAIPQIQLGNAEEAAAALKNVLATVVNNVPRVDPNAVTQYTFMKIQQTNAAEKFKSDHGDILANPMLARMAAIEEQARLNAYAQKGQVPADWNQFYGQLGMELRAVVGKPNQPAATTASGASNTTAAPQQSDKEARKAEIVELPTVASARASQPVEYKPKTREEILNDMRKSRGIPTG